MVCPTTKYIAKGVVKPKSLKLKKIFQLTVCVCLYNTNFYSLQSTTAKNKNSSNPPLFTGENIQNHKKKNYKTGRRIKHSTTRNTPQYNLMQPKQIFWDNLHFENLSKLKTKKKIFFFRIKNAANKIQKTKKNFKMSK